MQLGKLGSARIERGSLGDPLLKQQHGRLEQGFRLEPFLHRTVQELIGQGKKGHALVMRHVGSNHGARLSTGQAGRGVVDRFMEAESSFKPFGGQPLEIGTRLLGRHHERERRGIGRDHQVFREPSFEPQAGHAECPVLVVEMYVDGIVAAFRNAPGHPAFPPILDLAGHGRLAGPVEQGVFIGRHHQERHEVFEHRSAPRKQNRLSAAGSGEQTPQGEPVFLGQLSLGNRHETGKSRFRSQQIVVAGVLPMLAYVVSDGQQMARLIEQELIFHTGKIV